MTAIEPEELLVEVVDAADAGRARGSSYQQMARQPGAQALVADRHGRRRWTTKASVEDVADGRCSASARRPIAGRGRSVRILVGQKPSRQSHPGSWPSAVADGRSTPVRDIHCYAGITAATWCDVLVVKSLTEAFDRARQ